MLNKADISTELCGVKLQSPFILSSGPLSYAAEGLIKAHQAGAGAVVTKTIRLKAAVNPVRHISKINKDSLINCEKWADSEADLWFKREIPLTKEAGAVVIASVGHTLPEAEALVKDCERAGADFIELVSYAEDTLLPMLKAAKERVSIPVICKMSGNWPDPVGTAQRCLEAGADAISAIDSLGPTLKINIKEARPEMLSSDGYGWLSGGAIRPIALRIASEIARNGCNNLIGIGGVTCAEDAIEYLMIGASAVGVCSIAILRGLKEFTKLSQDIAVWLAKLGYDSISAVKGVALPNFPREEKIAKLKFDYNPDYAPCQAACPAGVDVPMYLDQIRKGDYLGAYHTISLTNPFPAICGRVCDHPCEEECRRSTIDDPLQIRLLKRFAADQVLENYSDALLLPPQQEDQGKKIAIIGAGPAGLTSGFYLAQLGYKVKVFEALPVAGGMMAVGIPDYRLPKEVLKREIDRIEDMGVEIKTNIKIGKDISWEELKKEDFSSIIIATGAAGESRLNIVGENLLGVLSGITFLRDINLGRGHDLKNKRVAVIGGGNVAVDSARSALRLGAKEVTIVYRREKKDMPAFREEVNYAEEEGVRFIFLAAPDKISGREKVEKLYYKPMKLGKLDSSGRGTPLATGEPSKVLEVDIIIIAVGQKVDTEFLPRIKNKETGETEVEGVYAVGDCLRGPRTVIQGIADGKRVAEMINSKLGGKGKLSEAKEEVRRIHFGALDSDYISREETKLLSPRERILSFREVELGLEEDAARKEAQRCLQCGCINCQACVIVCPYGARTLNFPTMKVNEELCRSCGLCLSICPAGTLTADITEK
ncbi:MAG TPA: dihydroorotate dehydrogenase [Candidatus Atribacteria bacterium]|uniref:dihydrouracil dehydrogenase (NAD(+)) n=1 Tax=candidate division TA06 bacterium 34_109 TaxID=1635277 RepID=A0A117M5Z9_UNCT6|nr:MAG: Dihydroorotate dehydrogenase family protein [candidate division TA06 bacterium 34_109]HBY57680.1 dihydroorotate dehydrogenase [Candidatus Atribacteria bacterium]